MANGEKLGFSALRCGDSFFVSDSQMKVTTLRAYASKRGKELNRKFSVTVVYGGCEVTRTDDAIGDTAQRRTRGFNFDTPGNDRRHNGGQ